MTILFQRLFFVVFIIASTSLVVNGQGDGDDDDKGGIFQDKTKAKSGGGGCPGCPPCALPGEIPEFSVGVNLDISEIPCDLYLGITFENGTTYYNAITSDVMDINFSPSDYQGCVDGVISITYIVDLYCYSNGTFEPIIPCDSDGFQSLLPIASNDDCSLATTLTFSQCCLGGTSSSGDIPTPETLDNPIDPRSSKDNNNSNQLYIYSLDGLLLHEDIHATNDVQMLIENLPLNTGIYIVVRKDDQTLKSKKYFKF